MLKNVRFFDMATENKPEGRSSNIKEKLYSHRKLLAVVLIGVVGASVGLGIAWPYMFPNLPGAVPHLRMATTTSVDNSGLLAYLVPDFESPVETAEKHPLAGFLQEIFADISRAVEDLATDYHVEYVFKEYLQRRWNDLMGKL